MNNCMIIRAHPVMTIWFMKRYIYLLLVPIIQALLTYGSVSALPRFIIAEFMLLAAIGIISDMRTRKFRLFIFDKSIMISSGLFIKSYTVIKRKNISCVTNEKRPLTGLLGAEKLRINTEAGNGEKDDFYLYLRRRDAKTLIDRFHPDSSYKNKYRCHPLQSLAVAFSFSSVSAGLLIAVPVINRTGKILGEEFNRSLETRLKETIDFTTALLGKILSPAVTVLTTIILIVLFLGIIVTFFRSCDFSLSKNVYDPVDNKLEFGILPRSRCFFKSTASNAVAIIITPVLRLSKALSVCILTAGIGKPHDKNGTIIPFIKKCEFKKTSMFPDLSNRPALSLCPEKGSLHRFVKIPIILIAADIALTVIININFPFMADIGIPVSLIIVTALVYCIYINYLYYKNGGVSIKSGARIHSAKLMTEYDVTIPKEKISAFKISQNPFDIRHKTCSVRTNLYAEKRFSLKVKCLKTSEVSDAFYEHYEI